MSALKGLLAGISGDIAAQVKNGVHADLRRAGIYDKATPSPTAPAPKPAAAELPGASGPGMTAAEVQQLLARERAFERTVAPAALNDRQRARMEESYQAVNPSDPAEWARGYLDDLGIGNKNASPSTPINASQQTPASAQPAPAAPAPARATPTLGSPAPGDQRDAEAILLNRPLDGNTHDFERLVAQHGRAKALEMWQSHVKAHLGGVRLVPENRRQR